MGDEILKKNILLLIPLFINACALNIWAQNAQTKELSEYDNLFSEISAKRSGVKAKEITKVKNPFVTLQREISSKDGNTTQFKQITYTLYAILSDRVKINQHWYKINDTIGYYKLKKIKHNSVLLVSASEKKELFLRKDNEKYIQFSSK
jgi:hypothetical protein